MHSVSSFCPFFKEINVNILFSYCILFKVLFLIYRNYVFLPCDMLTECHFLRPNPRQPRQFKVFRVVGGVLWAAESAQQAGGTECFPRVVLRSLFPCGLRHKQDVHIALLFSIAKQLGVPYCALIYIHVTYTLRTRTLALSLLWCSSASSAKMSCCILLPSPQQQV